MSAILPPDVIVGEFNNPERLDILIIEAVAAHVRKLPDLDFYREGCEYAIRFPDLPGMPVPPTRKELRTEMAEQSQTVSSSPMVVELICLLFFRSQVMTFLSCPTEMATFFSASRTTFSIIFSIPSNSSRSAGLVSR